MAEKEQDSNAWTNQIRPSIKEPLIRPTSFDMGRVRRNANTSNVGFSKTYGGPGTCNEDQRMPNKGRHPDDTSTIVESNLTEAKSNETSNRTSSSAAVDRTKREIEPTESNVPESDDHESVDRCVADARENGVETTQMAERLTADISSVQNNGEFDKMNLNSKDDKKDTDDQKVEDIHDMGKRDEIIHGSGNATCLASDSALQEIQPDDKTSHDRIERITKDNGHKVSDNASSLQTHKATDEQSKVEDPESAPPSFRQTKDSARLSAKIKENDSNLKEKNSLERADGVLNKLSECQSNIPVTDTDSRTNSHKANTRNVSNFTQGSVPENHDGVALLKTGIVHLHPVVGQSDSKQDTNFIPDEDQNDIKRNADRLQDGNISPRSIVRMKGSTVAESDNKTTVQRIRKSMTCKEEWKYMRLKKFLSLAPHFQENLNISLAMDDECKRLILEGNPLDVKEAFSTLEREVFSWKRVLLNTPEQYVWKFAFLCHPINGRIDYISKQNHCEIELDEHLLLKSKPDGTLLTDEKIQTIMTACVEGLDFVVFKIHQDIKEDVTVDIDQLNKRRATSRRPNPFLENQASVFFDMDENQGNLRLVLVALTKTFEKCKQDIEEIILRYEPLNDAENPLRRLETETETEETRKFQIDSQTDSQNNKGRPEEKTANVKTFNVNIDKWKLDWLLKTKGELKEFETSFCVSLEFSDGRLHIAGDELELDQFIQYLKENTKNLTKEVQPIDTVVHQNMQAWNQTVPAFEKKYEVAVECSRILDQQSDVQLQLEGVTIVLARHVTYEQSRRITLRDSSNGTEFIVGNRNIPRTNIVQEVLDGCTEYTCTVSIDDYQGQLSTLRRVLQDFVKCLVEKRKGKDELLVYLVTDRTELFFCVKTMLERFEQPNMGNDNDGPLSFNIQVVQGELAKQKVDVIVNSSNENLNLTEGIVSRSLVQVAGSGMQQEASMNYPRGIKAGELAETKGFGLQASKVIHTCLIGWNNFVDKRQEMCRLLLRTIITRCLQRTEELRLRSIAFPALGTGVLKYPNDVAASEMMNAAQQYHRDNPNTCIRNVVFVIYTSESRQFKVFKDKLNDLDEQGPGKQQALTGIDAMEFCAVISGKKEDVAKAVANFDEEIVSAFKYELSGKSMKTELTGLRMNIDLRPEEPNHVQTYQDSNRTPHELNQTSHNKQHGKDEQGIEEDQASDGTTHAHDNKGPRKYKNVVEDARQRMTADKGAIPKTSKVPREVRKAYKDPEENNNTERTKATMREKDIDQHSDEKDNEVDEILDKYFTNITVTLKKDVVEVLRQQNINGLSQKLKELYKVELDTETLALKGTAKDIALASDEIIKALQVDTHNSDQTDETDESENSDKEGDSYDSSEQTLFEQTLSLRSSTRVGESKKMSLMKIRPEVLHLCKIIHRDLWNSISEYSSERYDHDTVSMEIRNVHGMEERFYLFKEALIALDKFQYIELDPRFAVNDILQVVGDIKGINNMFDEVYVLELGDTITLAGENFEELDELRGIVEHKVMKGRQKPRIRRQLSDANEIENTTPLMHIDNHFATNDKSEESRTKFDTRKIPGCRQFQTNEGIRVYVYKASILKLEVDCIVNAANSKLEYGGGIAKVIAEAAGQALYRESREIIQSSGPLFVGTCCVTSAGRLPYKRVIHTVGPCRSDYRKHETAKMHEDLYNANYSTLEELKHLQYTTIGIPSVSSGVPKKLCALQFCLAVEDFSRNSPYSSVQEVHFIDVDEEMLTVIALTCDIVFNKNAQAQEKLRAIVPNQKINRKAKVRELMHIQKNKRHSNRAVQQAILKTELDIQISEGFRVLVIRGDITTFSGNVVVCGQDKELQCNSGVARALMKVDKSYCGNLKSRYHKVPYHEGKVLEYRSRNLGYDVYNVVVPKGDVDLQTLSFCYSQVLEKAELKPAAKIAVPIFISGSNQDFISQVGRMLAGLFIEMINKKGSHYKYPDVYIYDKDKHRVDVLVEAMEDILIEREKHRDTHHQGQWSSKQSDSGSKARKVFKQRITNKGSEVELSGRKRMREQTDKTRQGRVVQPFSDLHKEDETHKEDMGGKSCEHDSSFDPNSDKPINSTKDTETSRPESLKCVICMDSLNNPKTLTKCGHTFCTDCIDRYFEVKPVCPTCSTPYGILTGTQPDGHMKWQHDAYVRLPGYERCGAIKIFYTFSDGIQGEEHPNPGYPYTGTRRVAYLPDNERGRKVCKMLEVAFKRRLVFTIGRSVTTGAEDTVTWNDIHHKTNVHGGPAKYGYPDPDYLNRVTEELAVKGVTEADIY